MRKTQEQEKGITLIALVLTIIVLMILAAVSVAILTGDNGILTKAQEAKETAKKAEIEEQLRLAELSAKIKREGGAITVSDLLQELESQGVDFETGEDGKTIIVEGTYIIGVKEENGSIKFEDLGTTSKPKPKATYTVTYDANGGTGAPSPDTKIEGTDLTLNTTTVPTRVGYTFKGWGTSSRATEVVTTYTRNENITFFAIWESDVVLTNGYTYSLPDDDSFSDSDACYSWSTDVIMPTYASLIEFRLDGSAGNPQAGEFWFDKKVAVNCDGSTLSPERYSVDMEDGNLSGSCYYRCEIPGGSTTCTIDMSLSYANAAYREMFLEFRIIACSFE